VARPHHDEREAGRGTLPGSQQAVSIFGRKIAFQNNGEGPWNLYLGSLIFFTGTG
jgi:hypothetical protein